MAKPHSRDLQAIKRFEALHKRGKFDRLSSSEFQFMVIFAINRKLLILPLKVELLSRIRSFRMSNAHLNELILKAPHNDDWNRIKLLAFRTVLKRDAGVFSLLNLGTQILDWAEPAYDLFEIIIEGKLFHFAAARVKFRYKYRCSNYHGATNLIQAKYLAASELVVRLLGYDPKGLLENRGIDSSELRKLLSADKLENWKTKLYEYCAKNKLSLPIYSVRLIKKDEQAEFEAVVSIGREDNFQISFPHRGLTHQEAEQRASQSLFQLAGKKQAEKVRSKKVRAIKKIDLSIDGKDKWGRLKRNIPLEPVGRLRYYCVEYGHRAPRYTVHPELVGERKQLKVTAIVVTGRGQTHSFHAFCSELNRRSKVNKTRQYVAVNLLKKLQKLQKAYKPEPFYWQDYAHLI